MKTFSRKIADTLIQNGAEPTMKAVYAYGIECTLSTLLVLVLQIAAGFILGKPLYMVVFIAAWLPLRMLAGGAHANTHAVCTLISVGLAAAAVLLAEKAGSISPEAAAVIGLLSYAFFFAAAPVIHKNHPISLRKYKGMRIAVRIYAALECAVIILLAYRSSPFAWCALAAYASTAALSLWGFQDRYKPRESA